MKNLNLQSEFGARLVTLNTGAQGLRSGLPATVKAVDGPAPQFDFIASDETTDRCGEVIRLAGWDLRNCKANPVIPDCHDYSSISRIFGKAVSIEVKGGALRNRVEFCLENPLGALAYKLTQGSFLKCQSVGFIPLAWETGNGIDEPKRTYSRQELTEISLVVVPANPGAAIGAALNLAPAAAHPKRSQRIRRHECGTSLRTGATDDFRLAPRITVLKRVRARCRR